MKLRKKMHPIELIGPSRSERGIESKGMKLKWKNCPYLATLFTEKVFDRNDLSE